jgi:hypothetical protein
MKDEGGFVMNSLKPKRADVSTAKRIRMASQRLGSDEIMEWDLEEFTNF